MTGTGTQTQTQTRTTGVTTIALLILRTGELKNELLDGVSGLFKGSKDFLVLFSLSSLSCSLQLTKRGLVDCISDHIDEPTRLSQL